MRRTITIAIAMCLLASLGSAHALAGKKKKKAIKVSESITGTLLPFPKDDRWEAAGGFTRPGCTSGEEGVHWVATEFTAPGKGKLRFYMEGFTGDHDIYILDGDVPLYRGDTVQVGPEPAPAEEEIVAPLKKGQTVTLAACNWMGAPEVVAHYEGTFR